MAAGEGDQASLYEVLGIAKTAKETEASLF
jgi:hypothetical protein